MHSQKVANQWPTRQGKLQVMLPTSLEKFMPSATLRPTRRNELTNISTYMGKIGVLNGIIMVVCFVCLEFSSGCGGGGSSAGGNMPAQNSNPAPVIVSLSPNSASAGATAFTLTVSGNNFISSSTIQWNGSPRATIFSSSTQLQAQIGTADVASSGFAEVSVTNPSPGGGELRIGRVRHKCNSEYGAYSNIAQPIFGECW